MTVQTHTRNATLGDLAELLKDQHARKVDMVVPASKIRAEEGLIAVKGAEAILDEDGVTEADGLYRPTAVFDEGVAEKLGMPLAYVRRLRAERPDLYDANVNGWLHGRKAKTRYEMMGPRAGETTVLREGIPGDGRSFLLRTFKSDDGGVGIGRALLSDRYKTIDNLDVLTAALKGVERAGVDVHIDGCDLSDRRMYVRLVAPEVSVVAERLLAGYRNPFGGDDLVRWREVADREGLGYGGEEPIIYAGFVIGNSEVGSGAFSITPRMVIRVCKNGLTITKDMLRATHLGGRLDEGVIRWSEDTQSKNLDLVTAQARDAVETFLDVDYVTRAVASLEEAAEKTVDKADEVIKTVGKKLKFDEATIDGVLGHFIRGGMMTAGGVMNAVTAYAQTVADPDKAYDLEGAAVRALETAASL